MSRLNSIECKTDPASQNFPVSPQNDFKKYFRAFFSIVILCSASLAVINWQIDPLQFYRKASYSAFLNGQKRFQNPGLAKHYDYNAVVIGTSVSENFRAKTIKDKLGLDSMNFAMQGASAHEQSLMLRLALRTGKVKTVIWDIQFEYLRGDPEWVANYDGNFPYYFYDKNPLNDIYNYLLNIDTTKSSLKILLKRFGMNTYPNRDLEEFYTWDTKKKFGKASVQQAWKRAIMLRPSVQKHASEYALANLNANFDINYLAVIERHPETTFHLYFPPFTPGYYFNLQAASPEILQHMFANRKHIIEKVRNLKNVRLHDFQTLPNEVFRLENYCDAMHFNRKISDYIIESIALNRHPATDANNEELRSLVAGSKSTKWMDALLN